MEAGIRIAGLLIVFVLGSMALFRRDDRMVVLFAALGGLTYFAFNVGFVLSPDKLLGMLAFVWILLNQKKISLIRDPFLMPFFVYAVYLFYLTLFMSLAWPDFSVSSQSFLYSSTMRGFVQLFQLTMAFLLVIIIADRVNTTDLVRKTMTVLLVSYILLSIYGLYVWVAQQVGLPFNPITRQGRANAELGRNIHGTVDGVYFMRAYSLTGEPKALALNVSLAFVLLYFTPAREWWILRRPSVSVAVAGLFVATLILTLSTAGYLMMPLFVFAALCVQTLTGVASLRFLRQGVVLFLIAAVASVVLQIDLAGQINSIFSARLFERLQMAGETTTYADAAILNFWSDQVLYALTGVGLGGSSFYVRQYNLTSYAGYTAAPRGIIGFVSDQGLIGLMLYLFAFGRCAHAIFRAAWRKTPARSVYVGMLVLMACGLMMQFTISMWYLSWLIMGLSVATARLAQAEQREARMARQSLYASKPDVAVQGPQIHTHTRESDTL